MPSEQSMYGELPEYFNVAAHFLEAPAASHPERLAIVGEPAEVTCAELAALANRTGNALRGQGISRGDRVLIVLPDSAEFVAAFFGAAKIGAVAVPMNTLLRPADYAYLLHDSRAKVLIVSEPLLPQRSRNKTSSYVNGRTRNSGRIRLRSSWKTRRFKFQLHRNGNLQLLQRRLGW